MNTCPICHAKLAPVCSRCGAELTPLIRIIQQSQVWLQTARDYLVQGDYRQALDSFRQAQSYHRTTLAQQLESFCRRFNGVASEHFTEL